MKVFIPEVHFKPVAYTFKCLFEVFLGIEIELIASRTHSDFTIQSGDKSVCIESKFFDRENRENLFCKENIPGSVDDRVIDFNNKEFPVLSLYGKSSLTVKDQNHIELHADIIGSTFFMLSRWEEAVVKDRDSHDRFDYRSGLSHKMGFYQRPIVNEYIELVWELCRFLNPELKRKKRSYASTVTSDIDQLRKWKKPKILFESIYHHFADGKLKRIPKDIGNYLISLQNFKKDCFNNLEYIALKTRGLKTIFYFKTGYSHPKHDKNRYETEEYRSELESLSAQNVKFGIHPHYHTYNEPKNLIKDIEKLELFLGRRVSLVRQHFLRFSVPETWRHQAAAGLLEDSTMLFPDRAGFRNGVCYPFPVFDFENDLELGIYESPLLLMETSYLRSGFDQLIDDAQTLISLVRKYHGNFVFLWHNGNLVYKDDRRYFEKLIELASEK